MTLPKMPGLGIIRLLALMVALGVGLAIAQAPVEERKSAGGNSVAEGQQRLEFLRREWDTARDNVRRAEAEFVEAKDREDAAKKQLDAAKKQRDAVNRTLEGARRQAVAAQKAYEAEAAQFDRVVRGGAKDARDSTTKK